MFVFPARFSRISPCICFSLAQIPVKLSRFSRDSASSCAVATVFVCASFQQKRPSPGGKSPGPNAFVPASIHNIGFCVKVIVNDIQFQTAKKGTINIFSILPVDTTLKFALFRRKSCNISGLTSDTLRCILSAYYFKRQRRRGNTAVSLPLFISQTQKMSRKGCKKRHSGASCTSAFEKDMNKKNRV
jgi:hypothetical protein